MALGISGPEKETRNDELSSWSREPFPAIYAEHCQMWPFVNRPTPDPVMFVFGKTPEFGDFVEHALERSLWLKLILDDLVLKGGRNHPEPWFDLEDVPRAAMIVRRGILGIRNIAEFWMEPSCDSHGRKFPLIAGWHRAGTPTSDPADHAIDIASVTDEINRNFSQWNIGLSGPLAARLLELRTPGFDFDDPASARIRLAPFVSLKYRRFRIAVG